VLITVVTAWYQGITIEGSSNRVVVELISIAAGNRVVVVVL
jgi:hypothetical protein